MTLSADYVWHVTSAIPVLNTALLQMSNLDTAIDTIRLAGVYIKSVAEIRSALRRNKNQNLHFCELLPPLLSVYLSNHGK